MAKKILIFAHYYYPDVASTGQLLKELAEGLRDVFDVTVICVVPSYSGVIENRYKIQKYYLENIKGVNVIRIRVPEFIKNNKLSRIKNILAYFLGALGALLRSGKQNYVFTISQPPVLGGMLGVCGKWIKHAKMIYCIQDFNPEQIMAVGYFNKKFLLRTMMNIDKFCCKHSSLVITVGRDLEETLKKRFNNRNVPKHVMINNWINENEIFPLATNHEKVLAFKEKYDLTDKFVFMYSGNIGLYYDLENLIKVIEKFKHGTTTADGREVVFVFVGAGAVVDKLVAYKREHHMDNVTFIPYQNKNNLIYSLNAADVHWCVNAKGIKGVSCPSKYYGIASCGKAVLGVLEAGSEIRMLIEETQSGFISDPGDYKAVEKNIQHYLDIAGSRAFFQMGQRAYNYLLKNLTKEISIKKYLEAIDSL